MSRPVGAATMTSGERVERRSPVAEPTPYAGSILAGAAAVALLLTGGPSSLTPTTRAAVRETATAFLPAVEWPVAAKLVMVLYQGPYLIGLFGSIAGLLVAVLIAGCPESVTFGTPDTSISLTPGMADDLLGALLVHGVVVSLVAYLPILAYFRDPTSLLSPFGPAVLLGPLLVVAFTAWGGWAVAVAGAVDSEVLGTGLLLGAFAPPFVGIQVAHVWPTLHPGPVAGAHLAVLVVLLAVGRHVVSRE